MTAPAAVLVMVPELLQELLLVVAKAAANDPGDRTLLKNPSGCVCRRFFFFFFRMLSKHERYYALGMDALVIVCSRNTNVTMVWAWIF